MPAPMERGEFAKFLTENDQRIEPAIIGAVASALVSKWGFKSELVSTTEADEGIRVPQLSLSRPLGPFSDEHQYNQVLGDTARFLNNGDLSRYMETGRGDLTTVSGPQNESTIGIVVSRITPPNGTYSTLLFGELMLIEFALEEADCVSAQPVNISMAQILLGHN